MSPFYLVNVNIYVDGIEDVARPQEALSVAERFMRELLRPYEGATFSVMDVDNDTDSVNISVEVDGLVKHF